jgi:Spy/CpxP family protein refolding chaperone
MKTLLKTGGMALAVVLALPAAGQAATALAAAPPAAGSHGSHPGRGGVRQQLFASLSPAGQAVMRDAMKGIDRRADHAAIKVARDQILLLLDADKLDVAALQRAMETERATAQAMHDRRQAALLVAYQKLSVADRKALVAEARAMRGRMDSMMGKRGGATTMPGGMDGMDDMPPPPAR